jgi:putative transposase
VYLAVLMDVSTRCIDGWHLSRPLDHARTLTALRLALVRQQLDIHHSDQGVQDAATASVQTWQVIEGQIHMVTKGEGTEHGYAERLMCTIQVEEVRLYAYTDVREAYQNIGSFLDDVYQPKQIHSAFGYLTPAAFKMHWLPLDLIAMSAE